MKITVGKLRKLIVESFGDDSPEYRVKIKALREIAESKRPHLRGQWTKVPRPPYDPKYHGVKYPDCWSAEDPQLGTIYLNVTSTLWHELVGRLRDPSRTGHRLTACFSLKPFQSMSWDCPVAVDVKWRGEDRVREEEKFTQFRTRIHRLFGINSFEYKGDIFKKEEPKTAATPAATEAEPTATPSTAPASGEKLYKLYGKGPPGKRDASKLHTGHKGKFYMSPDDTKFKANDKVRVTLSPDGRLKVVDPSSEHAQDWDPSER